MNSMVKVRWLVLFVLGWSCLFSVYAAPPLTLKMQELQHAIEESGGDWEVGISEISQLSLDSFRKRLGLLEDPNSPWDYGIEAFNEMAYTRNLPEAFDWRNYKGMNYMTGVKNQGSCGSCWAFAANAAFEARLKIDGNKSYDLSEQLLVSTCCDAGDCGGGYPGKVAAFIQKSGVPEESCYPYSAGNSQCSEACSGWESKAIKAVSTYAVTQSVDAIKTAIYNKGPVHLGFYIFSDFQQYKSGIYKHVKGTQEGGHAVVAMGWDDVNSCFIVKNSWGTGWGENGYFRIAYSEVTGETKFGMMANVFGEDINHDPIPEETELIKDKAVSVNGAENEWRYYYMDVPLNAANLVIKIAGGEGDADLYTQFNSKPTSKQFACRPFEHGNNEECVDGAPTSGRYYIGVLGYKAFSGIQLVASFESENGPKPTVIASDGFESRRFNGGKGWSGKWKKSGNVKIIKKMPKEGRFYVRMRKNNAYLERKVDLSGASAPYLAFAARVKSFELDDKAFVKISSDGTTFETVKTFTSADSDNQWRRHRIDLSQYQLTNSFLIVFDAEMNKLKDYLYIDDIKIVK